jgi:hypothetical protein
MMTSAGNQRTDLFHEVGTHMRVARLVGEGAHEAGQVHIYSPHAGDALFEAVRPRLALMPLDEDGIDGNEAEPAPHAQPGQHRGFAQADDGNVDGAADLQKAGLLEVADDEGVVTSALRLQGIADRLRGAAEFRQRVKQMIGRIEAVYFEPVTWTGHHVQEPLQPLDIGSLLGRVDEALVPQPGGTGRLSHMLPLPVERPFAVALPTPFRRRGSSRAGKC